MFGPEHEAFRDLVRTFLDREVRPYHEKWEEDRIVPRQVFAAAGDKGLTGFNIPEEFGGGGSADFRFNAVIAEEMAHAGVHAPGLTLHNDIIAPYLRDLADDEQRRRPATTALPQPQLEPHHRLALQLTAAARHQPHRTAAHHRHQWPRAAQ